MKREIWTVREIRSANYPYGYGIFEGEKEIHRLFGHKMGLQKICDAHNGPIYERPPSVPIGHENQ